MAEDKKNDDGYDELESYAKKFSIITKLVLRKDLEKKLLEYQSLHGGKQMMSMGKMINMCIEKFFDKEESNAGIGVGSKYGKYIKTTYDLSEQALRREVITSYFVTKLAQISEQEQREIVENGGKVADEIIHKIKLENKIEEE